MTTRKGGGDRGDKSDGISGRLCAWCYRGKKGSVADIIVPELFRVLWLLLLFVFLSYSTSGSVYFRVRE